MSRYKFTILKIVDFHCTAYIGKSIGSNGTGVVASLLQESIYLGDFSLPLFAACAYGSKFLFEDGNEESLNLDITKTTTTVMSFQFIKVRIFGKIFLKMFGTAEGIEIGENGIAFNLTRILHAEVVRVGVHSHNVLTELLGCVGQIYAVSERLAHLCLTVGSRETQTGSVVREKDFRLNESFAIYTVEAACNLTRLFNHRLLVLTGRYCCSAERSNIGSLAVPVFKLCLRCVKRIAIADKKIII